VSDEQFLFSLIVAALRLTVKTQLAAESGTATATVITNADELVETGLQLMREQKFAGAANILQRPQAGRFV